MRIFDWIMYNLNFKNSKKNYTSLQDFKKKIPISVAEILDYHKEEIEKKFIIEFSNYKGLTIKDKDAKSNLFFRIQQPPKSYGPGYSKKFFISYAPRNKTNNDAFEEQVYYSLLKDKFESWLDIVLTYEEIELFQDPILEENTKKFYDQYSFKDHKSEYEPFNLDQQLFIDNYLTKCKIRLIDLKKSVSQDKKSEIDILIKEADEIRNVLTKEPKNRIVMRLSKFWGRAQKIGLEVIKEVFINVISEISKKLLLE